MIGDADGAGLGDGEAGSQAEPTGRVVVSQCGRMWSEGEAATGRREVSALVRSRISIYKERERRGVISPWFVHAFCINCIDTPEADDA